MASFTTPAVDAAIVGTRDATIATVAIELSSGEVLRTDGTSKRDPHDTDCVDVAELLALGRALENLSNKILKRANGLIKHHDDIRSYREVQKAKANSAKKKPAKSKTIAKMKVKG